MLPEPFQFLSVASYLSAPLLIGASLTIAGLRIWNDASDGTALPALVTVALSYVFGILYYLTVSLPGVYAIRD
jgi:ACR3 family arsenite efflux pump ArsB